MDLHGVLPILPTPFTADGAVDEVSMRRLVDFEVEVGAHGVSVLGFMGEAHRLAGFERKQVVAACVDQAGGAFPVWVGVLAFGAGGAEADGIEPHAAGQGGELLCQPVSRDGPGSTNSADRQLC